MKVNYPFSTQHKHTKCLFNVKNTNLNIALNIYLLKFGIKLYKMNSIYNNEAQELCPAINRISNDNINAVK